MIRALTKLDDTIHVMDYEGRRGSYSAADGRRLTGDTEEAPDEVLSRAWAQTRREPLSVLRKVWAARPR